MTVGDQGSLTIKWREKVVADDSDNFVYYCLLFYIFLFYSQIAGRFPVLAPLRIEFVVGGVLILIALILINRGERDVRENSLNIAAILFICFALFSIPFSLVRSRALTTFIEMFKFFAIYLMIIAAIDNERKLKGFFVVYLGMITLLFGEPFILSLQGKGFVFNNGMWRLAGVTNYFWHPNQLGGITSANLPIFFCMMLYTKSRWLKLLNLSLIIISLRVVMLTQSRTAFVGVAAFIIIAWFFSRNKLGFGVVLIIACAGIWIWAPDDTKLRFLTLLDAGGVISGQLSHAEAGSMFSRWVLIQRGYEAFLENPIMGLGLNNYISFNGMRYGYWFPPHNTYIQALSETGIIGFSIFISVLTLTFRNLLKTRKLLSVSNMDRSFLYMMATAMMIYLSVRIVVSMFGQDLYANYWWLVGSLSVVILRVTQSHVQTKSAETDSSETRSIKLVSAEPAAL